MGLGYTTTYTKITTVVTALFTAAVAAGVGLLCYYWVWIGMDKSTSTKIWIIVGLSLYGILDLLFGSLLTPYVWYLDESEKGDGKSNASAVILLILFCGVVPGVMVIVDLAIIKGRQVKDRKFRAKFNSGGSAPVGKQKAPDYDPDKDPAIIKKTGTSSGGKKKLVFKNPDREDKADPAPTKKKKLIFKPKNK